jgi:rhomboid family GlyGly-CTERM serine protease
MNVERPVYRFKSHLASLNCDGRYGLTLLGIVIFLLLPELYGETARTGLRYERAAIEAGQWWRLLTGHWVHLDFEHTLINVFGVVLMWALFARDFRPRDWLIIVAAIIAAIDVGLWTWDTEVFWYVGASGVLHGFMAAGTLAHVRRGDLTGWILVAALVLKIGFEQWHGALPFAEGKPLVLNAHLYGVLGGLAAAACLKPRADSL